MRYLIAVTLMFFLAGSAMAGQCPSLAAKIDNQLMSKQLDSELESKVKAMRDKGMELHRAGKHAESEEVLKKALGKLDGKGMNSAY